MHILGPTSHKRLNEAAGFVLLVIATLLLLSLISYHPGDPSSNTAVAGHLRPRNWIGRTGAWAADLALQTFGLAAFAFPLLLGLLAWRWIRSQPLAAPWIKLLGATALLASLSTLLSLGPDWRLWDGFVAPGGLMGVILADLAAEQFNTLGAVLVSGAVMILSFYLVSSFSMETLVGWLQPLGNWLHRLGERWRQWRERQRDKALARARARAEALRERRRLRKPAAEAEVHRDPQAAQAPPQAAFVAPEPADPQQDEEAEIPIRTLEDLEPESAPLTTPAPSPPPPTPALTRAPVRPATRRYDLPPTELLHEPSGRPPYDAQELKEIAARIKSKLEEFNVFGSVVQINPGPVVTTFEFKPEAGVKYSRITSLTEDLCLGLQAESILVERIPGKPTVGIEVPNTNREVIALRQILESAEFRESRSPLTMSLGKDISGRIKVAALDSMPHLLIAGSTGSGKSVMLNTMIMSVLFKATPNEVRMIMIDPKRVELGIYEGVPHLLTPVITDPRKATYALKNAVLEMERRLKLLAAHGVRNIEQFNRKAAQLALQPGRLFDEEEALEPLEPLPYILILIDELADLMMIERANVEEAVTRLAQMARAVGMHLVLATQRPSVDVITGLIKANFPARISFRVATRVDSRTILDVMGAEHLLGKGDMLFLPPGSSRLLRVHGAFVTEAEINSVVEFWKKQAEPDYDQSFLLAPPSEEDQEAVEEEFDGERDPLYEDAVRVVLEMGKASTSTLQRRLRLGYGRAARILDMMYKEGIIGPPDGSRPREVLRRPDWLSEVQEQLR